MTLYLLVNCAHRPFGAFSALSLTANVSQCVASSTFVLRTPEVWSVEMVCTSTHHRNVFTVSYVLLSPQGLLSCLKLSQGLISPGILSSFCIDQLFSWHLGGEVSELICRKQGHSEPKALHYHLHGSKSKEYSSSKKSAASKAVSRFPYYGHCSVLMSSPVQQHTLYRCRLGRLLPELSGKLANLCSLSSSY